MKRIIFILMLAFLTPMAVEAKAPAKTYQTPRRVKKAEKKSLPFAKTYDRRVNRKGLRR